MRTDELIGLLAQGAGAAPPAWWGGASARRCCWPAGRRAIAFAWLGFIPAERYASRRRGSKLACAAAMALAAASLVSRLARPGAPLGGVRGDGAGKLARRGGGRAPGWPRHKSCA